MHAKIKGNIGQFATCLVLSTMGFSVFTEEGDISKIDIIAEKTTNLFVFSVNQQNLKMVL